MKLRRPGFFRNNGLSLALLGLFVGAWIAGQLLTGQVVYNEKRREQGESPLTLRDYATSAHFVEATAENWESEFLQMFVFVVITAFLFQKGSAESNDPEKQTAQRPVTERSPWAVRKGGVWLRFYRHSLSSVLALLFLLSFWLHLCSGTRLENEERLHRGEAPLTAFDNLFQAEFWFESFKNWQSEFLAILVMVLLTIYLREKDSPESKALEAPHSETGE